MHFCASNRQKITRRCTLYLPNLGTWSHAACVVLSSRALLLVGLGAVARAMPVDYTDRDRGEISSDDALDLERAVAPAGQCALYVPGGPEACRGMTSSRTNSRSWGLFGAFKSAKECNQYYGVELPADPPRAHGARGPYAGVHLCTIACVRSLRRP